MSRVFSYTSMTPRQAAFHKEFKAFCSRRGIPMSNAPRSALIAFRKACRNLRVADVDVNYSYRRRSREAAAAGELHPDWHRTRVNRMLRELLEKAR